MHVCAHKKKHGLTLITLYYPLTWHIPWNMENWTTTLLSVVCY